MNHRIFERRPRLLIIFYYMVSEGTRIWVSAKYLFGSWGKSIFWNGYNLWIHNSFRTYHLKCFKQCLASSVGDYPLDLSILISGGKETKRDSPSNGERRGKSPSLNRVSLTDMRCGVKVVLLGVTWTKSCLDSTFLRDAIQGDSPVYRPCVVWLHAQLRGLPTSRIV